MMDHPLTLQQILEHGRRVHPDARVVTWQGDSTREHTFAESYERMGRLAAALRRLGVGAGDVVGSFCFNHQEHVEAYFAVPCMGAVLHTLNIRLFEDQLAFVVADGGDKVVLVDDVLVGALARVADRLDTVEWFVVIGDGDASALPGDKVLRYDDLLAGEQGEVTWPELDERSAASMCYTSGTTGNPKGVVYSHRSQWCHTFGSAAAGIAVDDASRLLVIVPQFHANAWGLIYLGWMKGADLLQPGRHLQPEPLTAFIEAARPTCSAAVPSVWNAVLEHGRAAGSDLTSLDWAVVGGSAVPAALIEAYEELWDVEIIQAWGMTETNPIGSIAFPPARATEDDQLRWRSTAGRIVPGIEVRIVDDQERELAWDAQAVGEFQARGPWVTAGYHGIEDSEKLTSDGWLRTGDIGTIDGLGFMQIVDRTKDVIKSGGEWISSVDLENALMAHPEVAEAAVIGVADQRWAERPLACVVPVEGTDPQVEELATFLRERVASWWVPERWAFVDEVPKTSVGKFDKKALRLRHEDETLEVTGPGDRQTG